MKIHTARHSCDECLYAKEHLLFFRTRMLTARGAEALVIRRRVDELNAFLEDHAQVPERVA